MILAPRMLKPASSAAAKTSFSLPTKMGVSQVPAKSRALAAKMRGSVPSVKTMVLGSFFSFSIMVPNPNILFPSKNIKIFTLFFCILRYFDYTPKTWKNSTEKALIFSNFFFTTGILLYILYLLFSF